ncbi:hypothetical protein CLCR_07424 [Cladophialophora carrionii]|uniref:Wbp11/ELF5/Saf1 N-terminal domain-containing protein n=1 Tax=Cladophialophora carrionii TaxID=86049 RepID=A0A1C1CQ40_9EURO|nr:hypothetical protein CLCR_07424 [Cladophialophora carrionii]
MAKDKERALNPAQQQRKLEKAKQLKKSRAELQARRNEKLARRNPERIQRQIDDIKALEAAGDIKPRERAILQDLERDLKAIRKARESLGEKAPTFGAGQRRKDGDGNNNVLGKRRHDGERKHHQRRESSGSDTDDSVRRIPMPEDTPPPLPRGSRRYFPRHEDETSAPQPDTALPSKPGSVPVVKTTYESAPQIRDLRKEAVNRFVPDVVRKKQQAAQGGPAGRLLEPEEMDRLEAEGYLGRNHHKTQESAGTREDEGHARKLAEEEARFLRELEMQDQQDTTGQVEDDARLDVGTVERSNQKPSRHVEIEEVDDEDT